jgi:hypothetical protein
MELFCREQVLIRSQIPKQFAGQVLNACFQKALVSLP